MIQPWRLQLRKAEEALRQGHLEEAGRVLAQGNLREFLPAQRLGQRLALEMAERGQRRLAGGDTLAGWHDLEAATRLGAEPDRLEPLRHGLVERTREEATHYLETENPRQALERLEELAHRQIQTREVRELATAARSALASQQLAAAGKFAEAEALLRAAAAILPQNQALAGQVAALAERGERHRQLSRQLHAALASEQWNDALAAAETLLVIAPGDEPARQARRRAWAVVGTPLAASCAGARSHQARWPGGARPGECHAMNELSPGVTPDTRRANRFLLWIDAVGGYLVCPGDTLVLGQPVPGEAIDIPILGDLSSRHAVIRRVGEGYLIEPVRLTRLNGAPLAGPTALEHGNVLELGQGVRLAFHKPHPLSATARLSFLSRHRTQPGSDGVILLAESCVLGPRQQSHVVCRDWKNEAVLFRQAEQLYFRTATPWEADGARHEGSAPISNHAHVSGEDFSLTLEELT